MVLQMSDQKNLESKSQTIALLLVSPTKYHGFITLYRVFPNTKSCSLSSQLAYNGEVLISEETIVTFSLFLSVEKNCRFLKEK